MRKVLSILVVALFVSIVFEAFTGPEATIAELNTTTPIQNGVSIYGLHVALPADMKSFPAELVPLP
jgi:hypothetical protein